MDSQRYRCIYGYGEIKTFLECLKHGHYRHNYETSAGTEPSAQVKDNRTFGYDRRACGEAGRVLLYPVPRNLQAFVRARFVLADRNCGATIVGPDERVGLKSRYGADNAFNLLLTLLQKVEQSLCAMPGIGSYDCVHIDTLSV
ncbi:MAG: hypothetical protein IMF05_12125 [Proteobacteria bacterium]|nr:hypothetical protein [Pseudomonadota bacterium]